ncbi:transposase [Ruania sp. N2-46]|uniref:Transposase n=1 Tax=Occultella gossypii TaxID=2800820 RepID=A0ABS7S508_9MICO|nr:transposase [Occultella gossypii]
MPETDRLHETIVTWWDAIDVPIVTGATNVNVEAANTTIKNIKRTGRSFHNTRDHLARILVAGAARAVARASIRARLHDEPRRAVNPPLDRYVPPAAWFEVLRSTGRCRAPRSASSAPPRPRSPGAKPEQSN